MRSVFLEGISSEALARDGLDAEFPDQPDSMKVVFSSDGESPVGYFYVCRVGDLDEQDGPYLIQADCSGHIRNSNAQAIVNSALSRIQARIGGDIRDYGD